MLSSSGTCPAFGLVVWAYYKLVKVLIVRTRSPEVQRACEVGRDELLTVGNASHVLEVARVERYSARNTLHMKANTLLVRTDLGPASWQQEQ